MPKQSIQIAILILAAATTMSGCIRPYKLDIQQGNVITQELVEQVQIGMTRREVQYILGTPLVTDPFHADRWDYFYAFKPGSAKNREQGLVTVVFENDKTLRIEGSVELQAVSAANIQPPPALETENVSGEEKPGLFQRTWSRIRGESDKE